MTNKYDVARIWLTSAKPFLDFQILPQSDPLPVDLSLSVGDIRRQIATEWLEIAQWILQSLFSNGAIADPLRPTVLMRSVRAMSSFAQLLWQLLVL